MSWLVLTLGIMAALLLAGLLLRKRFPRLSCTVWVLCAAYTIAIAGGTALCWQVSPQPDAQADYAVVLGYALQDGQPSRELIDRLQVGLQWLEETEDLPLIVTGGDPAGQGVTEAAVMAGWLEANGADMTRVWQEDQASDTRENFLFSRQLAAQAGAEGSAVMVITSDYHQTRACFWARHLGLDPVCRSSETACFRHLEASVREVYAFAKALMEAVSGKI